MGGGRGNSSAVAGWGPSSDARHSRVYSLKVRAFLRRRRGSTGAASSGSSSTISSGGSSGLSTSADSDVTFAQRQIAHGDLKAS